MSLLALHQAGFELKFRDVSEYEVDARKAAKIYEPCSALAEITLCKLRYVKGGSSFRTLIIRSARSFCAPA